METKATLTEAIELLKGVRTELFGSLVGQQSLESFNFSLAKRDGVDLAIGLLEKLNVGGDK